MIDDFSATLRAAQAGHDWAVGILWRDLNHRVVRYLRSRAGAEAEDLASETWLTVARKLDAFSGGEVEFRAWLFTIARSRLIDWQRLCHRRPASAETPYDVAHPRADDDPADHALEALDTEAALAMLGHLPPDQSDVILLRVLAGLDIARVATIVGKRPGAVRMLQHRGLQRLRRLLASLEPVAPAAPVEHVPEGVRR
jgi:RNA polymerase sigma-70 factor, ECF subfamily